MNRRSPSLILVALFLASTSSHQSIPSSGGVGVFPFRLVDGTAAALVGELQRRGLPAELLAGPRGGGEPDERVELETLLGLARSRGLAAIALVTCSYDSADSELERSDSFSDRWADLAHLARRAVASGQPEALCEGGLVDAETGRALAPLHARHRAAQSLARQISLALARAKLSLAPGRRLPAGVGFTRDHYSFAIKRDYDQRLEAAVLNAGNRARRVQVRVKNSYPDLVVGFLGAGSTAGPVQLEPGQLRHLRLIAGAPHASRWRYDFRVELLDSDSGGTLDQVPVQIELVQRQLHLGIEELPIEARAPIRELRVTNRGDEVTDLRAVLGGDLAEYAALSPSISQARLQSGESILLQVRARSSSPAGTGELLLTGNGAEQRYPLRLSGALAPADAIADRGYQIYRSRAEYCSNQGGAEVEVGGPRLRSLAEQLAYLQMRFTLRHDRATFTEHDTTIFVNGHEVGRLAWRIPEGTYLFPVAGRWLDPAGQNKIRTEISGMSGASYSVVSAIRLLAPADAWGSLVAADPGLRSQLRYKDVNLGRPDLGVFANPIERLPAAPFDGEVLRIPLLVKNLGLEASAAARLRLYNQDARAAATRNPIALLQQMSDGALRRPFADLQRIGGDVAVAELRPGQQTLLTVEARYLSAISTRLFVALETSDNDFDPDNNVQTLTFAAPDSRSPLLGTDYPDVFAAPVLGRMLKLPNRPDYRALWQQRLFELGGRNNAVRNLRALFGY